MTTCSARPMRPSRSWSTATTSARTAGARPGTSTGCSTFTPAGSDSCSGTSLDIDQFGKEITGGAHAAKIEHDVQEGIRNGVNATPKFYVDGERIDGKFPLEGLEDAIRASVRAVSAD